MKTDSAQSKSILAAFEGRHMSYAQLSQCDLATGLVPWDLTHLMRAGLVKRLNDAGLPRAVYGLASEPYYKDYSKYGKALYRFCAALALEGPLTWDQIQFRTGCPDSTFYTAKTKGWAVFDASSGTYSLTPLAPRPDADGNMPTPNKENARGSLAQAMLRVFERAEGPQHAEAVGSHLGLTYGVAKRNAAVLYGMGLLTRHDDGRYSVVMGAK